MQAFLASALLEVNDRLDVTAAERAPEPVGTLWGRRDSL
jgi:hypothetical protein